MADVGHELELAWLHRERQHDERERETTRREEKTTNGCAADGDAAAWTTTRRSGHSDEGPAHGVGLPAVTRHP